MITKAKNEFCGHGFTFGYCLHNCVKDFYHYEVARAKRKEFLKQFKKRDWKNPITKETIIRRLHRFHVEEQYVQVPGNLLFLNKRHEHTV